MSAWLEGQTNGFALILWIAAGVLLWAAWKASR